MTWANVGVIRFSYTGCRYVCPYTYRVINAVQSSDERKDWVYNRPTLYWIDVELNQQHNSASLAKQTTTKIFNIVAFFLISIHSQVPTFLQPVLFSPSFHPLHLSMTFLFFAFSSDSTPSCFLIHRFRGDRLPCTHRIRRMVSLSNFLFNQVYSVLFNSHAPFDYLFSYTRTK